MTILGDVYYIYSLEEKKNIEISTPSLEAIIWHSLNLLDVNKFYKGNASFTASPINDQILSALNLLETLSPFKVNEIPELVKLQGLKFDLTKASNGSKSAYGARGSTAQSELSKLQDRQKFLIQLANDLVDSQAITSMSELSQVYQLDSPLSKILTTYANLLIK